MKLNKKRQGHGYLRFIGLFIAIMLAVAVVAVVAFNDGDDDYNPNIFAEVTITRGRVPSDDMPPVPQFAGYVFTHWSYEPDGEAFDFAQNLYYDATFYAVWLTVQEYEALGGYFAYYEYEYYGYPYHGYEEETITLMFMWNLMAHYLYSIGESDIDEYFMSDSFMGNNADNISDYMDGYVDYYPSDLYDTSDIETTPNDNIWQGFSGNTGPDWRRLNYAINMHAQQPNHIIIFPYNAPANIVEGMSLATPNTFYLRITDPNQDNLGRTITTVPITEPTVAPAANPHRIRIARNVSISAWTGSTHDIIIRMPIPGFTNTPNQEPWNQNVTPTLGRHFIIEAGGQLTLGNVGNLGTMGTNGTLRLDGNAALLQGTARGGVTINSGTTLVMQESSELYNNRAATNGGAVLIENGGIFNMHGGLIYRNDATIVAASAGGGNGGGGGGVSFAGGTGAANSQFNMFGGTISTNRAAHGGGIWVQGGPFVMHGGLIYNNLSGYGYGTHFWTADFGATQTPQINVTNHHGAGGGVFICCSGYFTMHGGTIDGNTARTGGGVHLSHSFAIQVGGVWTQQEPHVQRSRFTMRGGNITNNLATYDHLNNAHIDVPGGPGSHTLGPGRGLPFDRDGGGIFITESGRLRFEEPLSTTINPTPINISGNTATRNGGGVMWEVGEWITAQRTTSQTIVANNIANNHGGGIYMSSYGTAVPNTLTMHGPWSITGNQAQRGGGVYMVGLTANPAILTIPHANTVISGNRAAVYGGGVFMNAHSQFNLSGGTIGGINMQPDGQGGTFNAAANTAQSGGGVAVTGGSTFNMNQGAGNVSGTIQGNIATGMTDTHGGGGVQITGSGSTFVMNAGHITQNESLGTLIGNGGGGVHNIAGATFTMWNGRITDNTAQNGGGVRTSNSTFTLHNGEITGNTAREGGNGGGVISTGEGAAVGTFTMNGGLIAGNNANLGGGVRLTDPNNVFNMHGGTIRGNTARGNGGGVSQAGVSTQFNLYAGTIGGLDMQPDGQGGTLNAAANRAINGGGIHVLGNTGVVFNIRGAGEKRIQGNIANGVGSAVNDNGGGGVFIQSAAATPVVVMAMATGAQNLFITDNRAPYGMGGGIFSNLHQYANPLTYIAPGTPANQRGWRNLNLINSQTHFSGNVANQLHAPPINVSVPALPHITFTGALSGHTHPLNNNDINFITPVPDGWEPDWRRLNNAININPAQPTHIVIWPHGTPGVPEGMRADGITFDLIVSDPDPSNAVGRSTITTLPIIAPASTQFVSPPGQPHRILITRAVTISAAPGSNINLRMPVPQSTNTAIIPPWIDGLVLDLHRHFVVDGPNAHLTLRGYTGANAGFLRIDGNILAYPPLEDPPLPIPPGVSGIRGGIIVTGGGSLTVDTNSVLHNNRAQDGGGIHATNANVAITGGTVQRSIALQNGGGLYLNNSLLNMPTGLIGDSMTGSPPFAQFFNVAYRGAGIFMRGADSHAHISGGIIAHNRAEEGGGGIYVTDGRRGPNPEDNSLRLSGNVHIRNHWRSNIAPQITIGEEEHYTFPVRTGGGVLVRGANTGFIMEGGIIGGEQFPGGTNFQTNRAVRGAGVAVLNGARFEMTGGRISGNFAANVHSVTVPITYSPFGGGVFVSDNNSHFYLTGSGVIGGMPTTALSNNNSVSVTVIPASNTSRRGSGVAVINNATFTMNGGLIAGNDNSANAVVGSSRSLPGADTLEGFTSSGVFVSNGAHFDMLSGHILRNFSSGPGGGVTVYGSGTMEMQGGFIAGNYASGNGGGIMLSGGAAAVVYNGTIGGTMYTHNGTPMQIEGNRATAMGAGVAVTGVAIIMPGFGPSVRIPSTFILNNGTIGGDRAVAGGIMGNHATGAGTGTSNGGGIAVINGAWAHIAGGNVRGNLARDNGGGIFATGAHFGGPENFPPMPAMISMAGGRIGGTNPASDHNIANISGGGGRITALGRLLMTGGYIQHNRAPLGAGLSLGAVTFNPPVSLAAELADTIQNISYTRLYQHEMAARLLMHYEAVRIIEYMLSEYSSTNDSAHDSGYVNYYGYVDYHGYDAYTGYVDYLGYEPQPRYVEYLGFGAFADYVEYFGFEPFSGLNIPPQPPTPLEVFFMNGAGAIIEGGRNLNGTAPANRGGGIYVTGGITQAPNAPTTARLTVGRIRNNNATDGGGIFVTNPNTLVAMDGAGANIYTNNSMNGGGVAIMNGGAYNMLNGNIFSNTATGIGAVATGGGGVFVSGTNSNFTMTSGTIGGATAALGNSAELNGGGIMLRSGASLTLNNGTISNNTALGISTTEGGGGIAADVGTTAVMHNGTISYNRSLRGGGVLIQGEPGNISTFTMHTGNIINNTTPPTLGSEISNGIGVRVAFATFYMHGGTISGHQRPAGTTGDSYGGGVFINGNTAVFNMNNGTIINNTVANGGGGVFMSDGAEFNMRNNATISRNGAWNGGGIQLAAAGLASGLNMYSGTIGGNATADANTATGSGGGVFVNGGTFYLRGAGAKLIRHNTAQNGGGVWVAQGAAMYMPETPLASNVQITNNAASAMGGGIFTQAHGDYPNPLPVNASNVALHFQNLTLRNVHFANNTANALHPPPLNVMPPQHLTTMPRITWSNTSPALPHPGYHHPINNLDINWLSESDDFYFWKVDGSNTSNRLTGAQFQLFEFNGITTPPLNLITQDMIGSGTNQWTLIDTDNSGTGATPTIMSFTMTPGRQYQLVETQSPLGFAMPMGQWRIAVSLPASPGADPTLQITNISPGTSIPPIRPCPTDDMTYLIHNVRDVSLPMSGGLGTGGFIAAGTGVLVVAALAGVVAVKARRKAKSNLRHHMSHSTCNVAH